jgi:predicted transcriptional regulator
MNNASGKIQFVTKKELQRVTKKAKKIERPKLRISKEESIKRSEMMIDFLKLIHPGNSGEGFKNPIELKILLRGEGSTISLGFFSLYGLDAEKELERLSQKVEEYFKFSHCMYFSLYTYDRKKEVRVKTTDRDGKATFEYKKLNKIVRENAVETWVLPMDFDNITKEEYERYRDYFKHLGIDILGIFTGYGYQMYILLDKPVKVKKAFEEFTSKLVEMGLPVDASIKDPSRVFRMPFSRNCKSYSSEFIHYSPYNPEGIETNVVDWSIKRYGYKDVLEILDKEIERMNPELIDINPVGEILDQNVVNVPVNIGNSLNVVSNENSRYEDLYEYLELSKQPVNVQNILKGTSEGFRNSCLMYLVPYLNKVLGLSQSEAIDTMKVFNELCQPSLPEEVVTSEYYRISNRYGHYSRGLYTSEMSKAFGKQEIDTLIKTDFDEIHFDNEVIKQFDKIHHSSIRLYLSMKLLEIEQEKEGAIFTKEEISVAANVSEKTVQRYMKELTRKSIVVKASGSNNKGSKDGYRVNKFGAYRNGFTKISKLLARDMIRLLKPGELAVYLLLFSKSKGLNKVSIFTAQENLALEIGLEQSSISRITDKLKECGYIKKETIMSVQNRLKTTYILRNK